MHTPVHACSDSEVTPPIIDRRLPELEVIHVDDAVPGWEDRRAGGIHHCLERPVSIRKRTCPTGCGHPSGLPQDRRHHRISLLHLGDTPWARIGEHVGQRNLAITANTYTHVRSDETEVDYGVLIRARMTHAPLHQEAEIVR